MPVILAPGGEPQRFTIQNQDGTTIEFDGIMSEMSLQHDPGISVDPEDALYGRQISRASMQATFTLVATGAPTHVSEPQRWGMTDPPKLLPPFGTCRLCGSTDGDCDCPEWPGGLPSGDDAGVIYAGYLAGEAAIRDADNDAVRELMESGVGDSLASASRIFLVKLESQHNDDPILLLRRHIDIGDPHPRRPALCACRFVMVERVGQWAARVRVEYEPPDVGGFGVVAESIDVVSPVSTAWDFETALLVAMIPAALGVAAAWLLGMFG